MILLRSGNPSAAFARTELVVVIFIVVVIAFLARPALMNALAKRDMTRTMNNARELYLAGFHMATDGAAKSDASLAWPGDYAATSLADYCSKLVQNNYLKAPDLQRILTAPGAACTVAAAKGPPGAVALSGRSALKVYKVKSVDPSGAIFSASANYIYNTPLSPTAAPFGDKGFVVIRKRGDAGIYGRNQATVSDWRNDAAEFRSKIGTLAGAADGSFVPGDDAALSAGPQ